MNFTILNEVIGFWKGVFFIQLSGLIVDVIYDWLYSYFKIIYIYILKKKTLLTSSLRQFDFKLTVTHELTCPN